MTDPLARCPFCGSDQVGKSPDGSSVRCLSCDQSRPMASWAAEVFARGPRRASQASRYQSSYGPPPLTQLNAYTAIAQELRAVVDEISSGNRRQSLAFLIIFITTRSKSVLRG